MSSNESKVRMSANDRVQIHIGDITTLDVDVIVNAANAQLAPGGGVCGAIFRAAGPKLQEACRPLAPIATGEACLTPGFNANAKWIVHALGPVWHGGSNNEPTLLASVYTEALRLAAQVDAHSIAIPAISTEIFGYPADLAAPVVASTLTAWCEQTPHPNGSFSASYGKLIQFHIGARSYKAATRRNDPIRLLCAGLDNAPSS